MTNFIFDQKSYSTKQFFTKSFAKKMCFIFTFFSKTTKCKTLGVFWKVDKKAMIRNQIHQMDRVKRIWYSSPMQAAKVQASLHIRAVSPEPPLLAHTSSEWRGTFRQKARSLAPQNGWTCAVKICHDGMLEDTNSLDWAQMGKTSLPKNIVFSITVRFLKIWTPGTKVFCSILFCWCLTPLWHFSGHSGLGQLSYPQCSWASLLGSLPILSPHSFASNWQLPFLNRCHGENSRRNYFMNNLHERMFPDVRIEPVIISIPDASDGWHKNEKMFKLYISWMMKITELQTNMINEPPHDKTNKMACAPSKDSDQPGHLPSLIRVFAVHSVGS